MLHNPLLDTFVAVADAGSFNKAAETLFISAPAVIKQINNLERILEMRLFIRTHRGLELTAAGKSLYRDAQYMIGYSQKAVERAKARESSAASVIRIGTSFMTPVTPLLELWQDIQAYMPDIKFQVVPFDNTPENAREILRTLGEHIDIVAGVFDAGTWNCYPYCQGLEIRKEPICCAVSRMHPLAAKKRLSLSDLSGETLCIIRQGWAQQMDALRQELQKEGTIHLRDFDFYNARIFNDCENGDSLLLAFPMWSAVHPLLTILPVDWPYAMPYGILHSPQPSPLVRQFLDAVTQCISHGE